MHTFLPLEQKKDIRKEYIVRLIITIVFTLLIVIICGVIFMMPAYVASYTERVQTLEKIKYTHSKGVTTETKEIEAQVKSIIDVTNRFSEGIARLNTTEIIDIPHTTLTPGVNIRGIDYSHTASSTIDMRVSGIATTRDALIVYKKSIEQHARVAKVELPVSDLAKSRDVTFVLRILSKYE